MTETDRDGGGIDRSNCMQLGFSSEQVEDVAVGDNGGVTLLLNEEGIEHLDQIAEMRGMEL